jgi:hypothetical protein
MYFYEKIVLQKDLSLFDVQKILKFKIMQKTENLVMQVKLK